MTRMRPETTFRKSPSIFKIDPLCISSSGEEVDDDQHLIKTHHLKNSEDLQKAAVLQDLEQLEKTLKEKQSNVFNVQVSSR